MEFYGIWPDWVNTARADKSGLGSIGLITLPEVGRVYVVGSGPGRACVCPQLTNVHAKTTEVPHGRVVVRPQALSEKEPCVYGLK